MFQRPAVETVRQLPIQLSRADVDIDFYILFAKSFQAAHPDQVEQIWNASKAARASKEAAAAR
ncbi:MAG: hypothetical protein EKK47_19655 [Burkholderiales bacterium]|jgi:hypothetical protein|nr:MAG: hypothetical protein EKK47_19655 [Burkholderiales bacterium]